MSDIKIIKLRNAHIVPLINWLVGQALPSKMSRARNRFIKSALADRSQELPKEIKIIKEKYCKKDKDKKPIMKKVGKDKDIEKYTYPDGDIKKVQKEVEDYLGEFVTIEIGPAMVDDTKIVKGVILETTDTFKDEVLPTGEPFLMATWYDEWCKAVEVMDGDIVEDREGLVQKPEAADDQDDNPEKPKEKQGDSKQ